MTVKTRSLGFLSAAPAVFLLVAAPALCGDDLLGRHRRFEAPLELPRITDLELALQARRRNRPTGNIESHDALEFSAGLDPLIWPRPTDMRSRLLTPQLRRTPVVGWIAENLYRSRKDNGWCLEVDPGEGEYLVFYRLNLK